MKTVLQTNLNKTLITSFFLTVLYILIPHHALSVEQTKNCHCFRNRTFNAADKFISDDYILTTTYNSLLASEFKIEKRQIIMMKMRDGVANTDLMTALFIARESGSDAHKLLQMKKKMTWQEIVKPMLTGTSTTGSKEDYLSLILTSTSDEEIAAKITHQLIVSRFAPSQHIYEMLKEKELTARQIILSFTLAGHAGIPVQKIADQFLTKGLSWSEIAHNLGLQPADAGKLLEKITPAQ